jgi:dCMP deaminase
MKHDDLYMRIADTVARQSHCVRLKVGAVVVRDSNIVSFGWNGTPSGFSNVCEDGEETRSAVVHAEANAIAKAARSTVSTAGSTIYLTHSPCWTCALSIVQSGIKRVVYRELYRDSNPLYMMEQAGVIVEQQES